MNKVLDQLKKTELVYGNLYTNTLDQLYKASGVTSESDETQTLKGTEESREERRLRLKRRGNKGSESKIEWTKNRDEMKRIEEAAR